MFHLIFNPLLSPWLLLFLGGLLLVVVYYRAENWRDVTFACGFVFVLLLAGFQVKLVDYSHRYPAAPIKLVYENSPRALRSGARQTALKINDKLKTLPGATVKVHRLDARWSTVPVFRDYNQLQEQFSAADPLQIIVGSGRHTAPVSKPLLADSPPTRRALYRPETTAETAVLRVAKPVQRLDYPGQVEWTFRLSGLADMEAPELVLKSAEGAVRRRELAPTGQFREVKLTSPRCEKGVHYFEAQLLDNGETGLPAGHARRSGVGVVVSDLKKELLIVDEHPRWRSGWWGRQLKEVDNWAVTYSYRAPEFEHSAGSQPDQVLYFGFPNDRAALAELRRWTKADIPLLFFADRPDTGQLLASTLKTLGFPNEQQPLFRSGEFSPRLAGNWVDQFSALARFENSLNSAPPFRRLLVNLEPGPFEPLLEAEGEFIFGLHPDRPLGFLASDDFHNLGLQWGRFGRPEVGGKLARSIVQKLFQVRPAEGKSIINRRHIRAGEPIRLARRQGRKLEVSGPVKKQFSGPELPPQVYFPRPGKYRLEYEDDQGHELSTSLLVVEPEAERFSDGTERSASLVRESRVFHSLPELLSWARAVWQQRKQRQQEVRMSWNHPLVLLLGVGLLTLLWHRRSSG